MLPAEIWLIIAEYTHPQSYFHLRLVSKFISQSIRSLLYPKFRYSISTEDLDYSQIKFDYFVWLISRENPSIQDWIFNQCCFLGRLDLVQYMQEKIFSPGKIHIHAFHNACMKGHLPIVQYLHQKGYPLTKECFLAAEYNHLPVVLYLHQHKCPYDMNTMGQTSCYGHYDMVEWLLRNGYPGDSRAVNHAASKGDRRMILLLHSYGIRGMDPIFTARLYKQPQDFLEWLQEQGFSDMTINLRGPNIDTHFNDGVFY